jgi:hypothetical protein
MNRIFPKHLVHAISALAACAALAGCGGSGSSGASSSPSANRSMPAAPVNSGSVDQAHRNLQAIATQCAHSMGGDRAALAACLKAHGLTIPQGQSPIDKCLAQAGDNLRKVAACGRKTQGG